ncbi:serine dehydratase subunit alpha family protein [Pantoea ananatis]|uniref:L-cysteine desulfidase family protein n=1 Tax=Pantoea ananas TaxID=553 RepID=UPI0007DAD796|nr:L-serine ammonia-lyase, iron-sulfur-dependent, subunit alpha [Pantoea ananatis]UYL02097.1 L-serine ammonia-lyase, iron-sulfur-dependent, subunit alpha [Pantoea ananatis]
MSGSVSRSLWQPLIDVVRQEVKPALGCTEPVSLALASAHAAGELTGEITHIDAWVSPNLMKNGAGVSVPGTGMVGLPIAAAAGALGGNPQAGLKVLEAITPLAVKQAKALLASGKVKVMVQQPCDDILYARACLYAGEQWARVTIAGDHTRVVEIVRQGKVCQVHNEKPETLQADPRRVLDRITLAQIFTAIESIPTDQISFILEAATLNNALSQEGLKREWGLHIGATLARQRARGLLAQGIASDIVIRTSAASDARMGGATLPAMSNSGSGNQGITATLPVVVVAQALHRDSEKLARALMLSHLTAIYIHHQFPRLSALCAATTAAMGAAAGMAWLLDGNYKTIAGAINNMIGDLSGLLCDGAANSCAMKVSTSVSSAWKAVLMAMEETAVTGNEGLVAHDVEHSIANLAALACGAMQHTDRQLIEIIMNKQV